MQHVMRLTLADGRMIPVQVSATRTPNGDWMAAAVFGTPLGPIRLTATASEEMVKAVFARAYPTQTAGWFDDIIKTISKVARSKAVTNVLEQVSTVANNPILQKVASLYPPAGAALGVIGKVAAGTAAAQSLIARAKGGEQKAQTAIASVAKLAQGGSQNARFLHNIFHTVNQQANRPPPAARPALPPWMQMPSVQAQPQPQPQQLWRFPLGNWAPPVAAGALAQPETDDLVNFIQTVRRT